MGKPVRIIGTTEDITEKKRAQAWVRELGAIVESSDDAIFADFEAVRDASSLPARRYVQTS